MSKINPWIQSVCISKYKPKTKFLNVFTNKNKKTTLMLTVPIDAPEIDPYDKETGKGFMTPNAIIQSGLPPNAKMMFSVLRSFICYNLGFVFPTEEQIEKRMSRERKANRKALKELEKYGVIRIVKMPWQGHLKNYYFFTPEDKWNLPEPIQFSYSKNSDQNGESNDSQIEEDDDIANDTKVELVTDGKGLEPIQTLNEEQELIDFFALHDE